MQCFEQILNSGRKTDRDWSAQQDVLEQHENTTSSDLRSNLWKVGQILYTILPGAVLVRDLDVTVFLHNAALCLLNDVSILATMPATPSFVKIKLVCLLSTFDLA